MAQYGLHEELARLTALGDRWAWWQLCDEYKIFLRNLAFKFSIRTKSMTIDDLVQESRIVLLKLTHSYKFDGRTKFKTWLINYCGIHLQRAIDNQDRIVHIPTPKSVEHRNTLRSGGTSYLPSSVDFDDMREDDIPALHEGSGGDSAYRSALAAQALRLAERLDQKEKIVLKLYLVDEYTFEEISKEIGRTRQGAINVYLRAIRKLRTWMQSDSTESPMFRPAPVNWTKATTAKKADHDQT